MTTLDIKVAGGAGGGGGASYGGGGATVIRRYTNEDRKKALLKVLAARKRGTLPKHISVAYHDNWRLEIGAGADSHQNVGGNSRTRADLAIEDGAKLLAWCDKTFGPPTQKDRMSWTRVVRTRYINSHNLKVPVDLLVRTYGLAEVTVPVEHVHTQLWSDASKDGNGHIIWWCRGCNKKLTIRERRDKGLIPAKG